MPSLSVQGMPPVLDNRVLGATQDALLPRSGLYPAPEHYTEAYTAVQYQQALQARHTGGALRPLSLMVQVPFCRTLCNHCNRTTIISHDNRRIERYIQILGQEMQLVAESLAAPTPLIQLHFGGGSPSQLSIGQLASLLELAQRYFPADFDTGPSLQVDPRHLTRRRLQAWHALGLRGLHIELLDINPQVQAAMGRSALRIHPAQGIHLARQLGFDDIRLDLLLGLPHQTAPASRALLATLIEAGPDLLRLTPYWHQPHRFPAQRRIAANELADSTELIQACREQLFNAGWQHLGLDRYARPDSRLSVASQEGRLRLDCLDYQWLPDTDRIGIGLGALSRIGSHYAQNLLQADVYNSALEFGVLPVGRGHAMNTDDLARHAIIHTLFCQGEVDLQTFSEDHLLDFQSHFQHEWRQLQQLSRQGLVWIEHDGFGATQRGKFHLPEIAAVFDRYGRHTRQLLALDTP